MKKIVLSLLLVTVAAFAAVNTKACAGCHGANFEKHAMGKSKIVANMANKDVINALLGYKKGTYGGSMKMVMKSQIGKYSDDEIKAITIGKSGKVEKPKAKVETKTKKTDLVLFKLNDKFAYKYDNVCWVVDYKERKTNLVKCSLVKSRKKLFDKGLIPPVPKGLPDPLFNKLFK